MSKAPSPPGTRRTAVGVMTGTSLDAVDVALASIDGSGLDMSVTLRRHESSELGPVAGGLRAAASGQPMPAGAFCELAASVGRRYAEAIEHVLAGDPPPDLIAVHGQTVHHHPPHSWQLVNPAPIAARFGVPVVSDLRSVDLALGGQGAPITPLADWVLFRDVARTRAIVNLGGFSSVTVLPAGAPPEAIGGYDVCACNQVLDAVARKAMGAPFDQDGRAASRGTADAGAIADLAGILQAQRRAGRSLGSADQDAAWGSWLDSHSARLAADDLAASAVAAVAGTIAAAIGDAGADQVVIAGGGARNQAILAALRNLLAGKGLPYGRAEVTVQARSIRSGPAGPAEVVVSDRLGVPVQAREALAMAVLGALAWDGVAVTVPAVTGASRAGAAGFWWLPAGPASGSVQRAEIGQAARVVT